MILGQLDGGRVQAPNVTIGPARTSRRISMPHDTHRRCGGGRHLRLGRRYRARQRHGARQRAQPAIDDPGRRHDQRRDQPAISRAARRMSSALRTGAAQGGAPRAMNAAAAAARADHGSGVRARPRPRPRRATPRSSCPPPAPLAPVRSRRAARLGAAHRRAH